MPELPEVEATRRLLLRHARGQRVTDVPSGGDDEKVFEGAPGREGVVAAVRGRTVADVRRLGKQFWIVFEDDGPTPVMHLGMTGQLWARASDGAVDAVAYVRNVGNGNTADGAAAAASTAAATWPPRFCKLELELESGARIAFCDARRFARIRLLPAGADPTSLPPLSRLGFDPLLAMPPLGDFVALLARRRSAKLKALLLDQAFSAGVGNWVADEVLWHARLHPEQRVGDLLDASSAPCSAAEAPAAIKAADDLFSSLASASSSMSPVARLHAALRGVCEAACAVDADSDRFPENWMFAHRWTGGKSTRLPGGERVEFMTAGGRTTAYVPAVQKMIVGSAAAAAGGRSGGGGSGGKKKKKKAEEQEEEEEEEEANGDGDGDGDDGDDKKPPADARKPKAKAAAAAASSGGKKKRAGVEDEQQQQQQPRKRPARRGAPAPARTK